MIKPIFLISLPRSGSTMLQKILMSHQEIVSTGEPWFLLPLTYLQKDEGIKAVYGHKSSVQAIKFLKENYLTDKNSFDKEIRKFALNMYENTAKSKNEKYFLDKTPRYYWILDDLIRIFPDAKFIVLVRNPISIFASTIESFHNNSLKRFDYAYYDFFIGPKKISEFVLKHKNNKNIYITKYEKLVKDTGEIERVFDFLELKFSSNILNDFTKVNIKGYGDHLGAKKFDKIVNNTHKWHNIIKSHIRKKLLLEYLNNFDDSYIELCELKKSQLILEVNKHIITKCSIKDLKHYLETKIILLLKNIFKYQTMH